MHYTGRTAIHDEIFRMNNGAKERKRDHVAGRVQKLTYLEIKENYVNRSMLCVCILDKLNIRDK